MKKINLIFALIALLCACADLTVELPQSNSEGCELPPNVVSLEAAEAELLNILVQMQEADTRNGIIAQMRTITERFSLGEPVTRSDNDYFSYEPFVHIFNFADDAGFALMAGHDFMPPLLAITERGKLDLSREVDNPGFIIYLDHLQEYYNEQLELFHGEIKNFHDRKIIVEYGPWVEEYRSIGINSFCPVVWGQSPDPYNTYMPIYAYDKYGNQLRAPSGCVATACAQLMAQWKWPTGYKDFDFDWDEMIKHMNIFDSNLSANNVGLKNIARIMHELGLPGNLDVNYGELASSASTDWVPRTLENFGYSSGGERMGYSTDKIVTELIEGYPVLARGAAIKKNYNFLGITWGSSYHSAHAWLIDGTAMRSREVKHKNSFGATVHTATEYAWYVRCNWGWDGWNDGYYLSGVFDARKNVGPEFRSGQENNYQYQQRMIIGIRK